MNAHTFPHGRLRSFTGCLDDLNADPGVMPSAWRFINGLPATQKLELALKILTETNLGDPDASLLEQAEISITQLVEDAREADRRQAIMIADGRPSLNPWAAPESGIWP